MITSAPLYHFLDLMLNILDSTTAVYMTQQTRLFIIGFKRRSLLFINSQAIFNSLFPVIFTLDQGRMT